MILAKTLENMAETTSKISNPLEQLLKKVEAIATSCALFGRKACWFNLDKEEESVIEQFEANVLEAGYTFNKLKDKDFDYELRW